MKKKIVILNNSKIFGGPQKSIIQNIKILEKNFDFLIITPKGSSLKNFLINDIKCIISPELPQFDNTIFGYYNGLKWIILLREIYRFFNYFLFLIFNRKDIRFKNIDIIHGNEINLLPAIFLTRKFLNPKFSLTHCRSVQNKSTSFVSKMLKKIYNQNLDKVICIDKIVAQSLNPDIDKAIIYNSMYQLEKINRTKLYNNFIIGVAGNMSDVKGTNFIIDTFKIIQEKNIRNISLYFLGEIQKNNMLSVLGELLGIRKNYHSYLKKLNNLENIYFLGFRDKVDYFYQNIDLLCFPIALNAVGRTVIEASQFKIPSLITVNSNIKDLDIANDQNSFFFNGRDHEKFADYIVEISKNTKKVIENGEKIYEHIKTKCDSHKNSLKLQSLYNSLIESKVK